MSSLRGSAVGYGVAAGVLAYLTYVVLVHDGLRFLDGVNLIFHEAGHWFFFWGPEFLVVLGGTLGQLLVPLVCLVAFLREARFASALVMLWWVGENFVNISIYAADARAQALPLLGGDAVGHDWAYLLAEVGLLSHDQIVGGVFYHTGVFLMLAAVLVFVVLALYTYKRRPDVASDRVR